MVAEISSYEALPNIKNYKPKNGKEMRLERGADFLKLYWTEFSRYHRYEVEIERTFTKTLVKSRVGERTVGAPVHPPRGALLFLPALKLDDAGFFKEDWDEDQDEGNKFDFEDGDEEEDYWTEDAMKFGKRLLAALIAMADSLREESQVTPRPNWTLNSEFQILGETELEVAISQCNSNIAKFQLEKVELESKLAQAGSLRRLLFEQGKPLENAILEALKLFGFEARPFSDGQSEFDSVFISAEGRCLGEAEGKDNKPINIDKFAQLERNLQEDFARDEVTEYAHGVLFGNAYRLTPPDNRAECFTEKCLSAAKRIGAALIRTPNLFSPAQYIKENPTDAEYASQCREAIFQAKSRVVVFPPPPVGQESIVTEDRETRATKKRDV